MPTNWRAFARRAFFMLGNLVATLAQPSRQKAANGKGKALLRTLAAPHGSAAGRKGRGKQSKGRKSSDIGERGKGEKGRIDRKEGREGGKADRIGYCSALSSFTILLFYLH